MAAFLGVADVEHGVSLLAAGGQAGEIIVGCGHGDRVSKWRCYFFIMPCCDVLWCGMGNISCYAAEVLCLCIFLHIHLSIHEDR